MNKQTEITIPRQIWHFILHLRWHYQVFILSGGYLLGGLMSSDMDWNTYLMQFLNVHLLLYGGATAYNSFWDRDTGAVGGLRNPPGMVPWMWGASLILQGIGLLLALASGYLFAGLYACSMVFFWLYSSPHFRWKGSPLKSLIAIGVSTGTNSFLMGYVGASVAPEVSIWIPVTALGVALIILSLYPASQLYQREEDRKRGDRTFAVVYGPTGVNRFFKWAFSAGILLMCSGVSAKHPWLGGGMLVAGVVLWIVVWSLLKIIKPEADGYQQVMRIKYGTSLVFVSMLIFFLLIKHTGLGILLGLDLLLQ